MLSNATTETTPALLSAPDVVAIIFRAIREGGPEHVKDVGHAIEPLVDPCAATTGPWGCWEVADTFDHWPGPITAAHQNWLTTCTA